MKVLVVDDALPLRERIVSAVGELGGVKVVAQAGGAREAVKHFRSHRPDVVMLDIQLSRGESGIQVLKTIKKEAPATVVMIFTNYATVPYRKHCAQAGADYFFQKRCDIKRLLRILRRLSQNHRASQANGAGWNETTHGSKGTRAAELPKSNTTARLSAPPRLPRRPDRRFRRLRLAC